MSEDNAYEFDYTEITADLSYLNNIPEYGIDDPKGEFQVFNVVSAGVYVLHLYPSAYPEQILRLAEEGRIELVPTAYVLFTKEQVAALISTLTRLTLEASLKNEGTEEV